MEQIYKYRSFPASIASGYKLFHANIRTIIFRSWIEALAFGIMFGLLLVSVAVRCKAGLCLSAAALVVASVFWNGRLFVLIDGGKTVDKLMRAAKATVAEVFFIALPLIGVPLMNVIMEIMLEDKPRFGNALATGFKHWGYLFATLLISGIIMVLLSLVICIPLYIAVYGAIADYLGTTGGDPSGLPTSFPITLFVIGTLTAFIMLFVQIWQTYALAYAHGAILTRERNIKSK